MCIFIVEGIEDAQNQVLTVSEGQKLAAKEQPSAQSDRNQAMSLSTSDKITKKWLSLSECWDSEQRAEEFCRKRHQLNGFIE